MDYNEIIKKNKLLQDLYNEKIIKKKLIEESLQEENKNIEIYRKDMDIYDKKKILLLSASEEARNVSKDIFEDISTNGLQTILGENLSVIIEFGEKNDNPTAEFLIKSTYENGEDVIVDPTSEDGGGAADIVALSSLLTINSLLSEQNSSVICIDEPTKFVSKGNSLDVAKFLKNITHDLNKQIIMVTHDNVSHEIADKSYYIELDSFGVSQIKDITKKNI